MALGLLEKNKKDEQTGGHVHELWFTTLDLVSFASEGLFIIAQIVQRASER